MSEGNGVFGEVPTVLTEMLTKLTERGVMTPEDIASLWPRLFSTGEEIDIRKSRFRIEYIGTDVLVLKLLPSR